MLPSIPVRAQEGDESVADITAVYYLSAESGSFADNGDGTYTLTLEGSPANFVWLINDPVLRVYRLGTQSVVDNWAASEGLVAEAMLEADQLNAHLELNAPTFDGSVLTFVATVSDVTTVEDTKDEPSLPETFGAANLSIRWTVEFQTGLATGVMTRFEGVRVMPADCDQALTTWNQCQADRTYRRAHMEDCMDAGFYLDVHCASLGF